MIPTATYRLQISAEFPLADAAALGDYLADLGAGAVYCSPLLRSTTGSQHGYDVVDPTVIDPARGGPAGWQALLASAAERALGIVVDIVPNHLGVADAAQNPAWWDVLRLGRASAYASWFDIDWSGGRILLPVLGDRDGDDALTIVDGELRYFEHRFPIAPGTEGGTPAQTHGRQHYELVNFRRADTEQNYRRFFAVTTLAGVRVEDERVFAATHGEILRWVRDDGIDGLRIDHPDGLVDPRAYLVRLREAAGPVWLTVEKILEPGEQLPPDWPADGTTGYDALAEVNALLVAPEADAPLTDIYQQLTGDGRDFAEHVESGKRLVASTILRAEVNRLARLVPEIPNAADALTELLVAFPVYRSYLPVGAEYLDAAVTLATARRPDLVAAIADLLPRLGDPDDELGRRFQQASGAIMAKGVEDTAYYRYNRMIAGNEVGGDPSRIGLTTAAFHAAQQRRAERASRGMTTLSTHDTKRGEDVRARLAVVPEVAEQWRALVAELAERAPVPNRAFGYLLWQTFAGVGLIERGRMHAYAEKAMREAADGTGWIDPVAGFEDAVHAAVDAAYDDPAINARLSQFIEQITPYGWTNSLSQKLIQLTMPGVPDVYQGTELWEDSLVDPDNRRPVDFDRRRRLLASLDADNAPPPIDATGAAKLWLVSRTLRLRRDRPELFGEYRPIGVGGPLAEHAVVFDRGGAITVASRLPVALERRGGWGAAAMHLGGDYRDVLTDRHFSRSAQLADLLGTYPVALLALA